MAITAWFKSHNRTAPASPGSYVSTAHSTIHNLHLFGKSISLKLAASLGLITAALTGATIYALEGGVSTNSQPATAPASNTTQQAHATTNGDSSGSSNTSTNSTQTNSSNSQSGSSSSTSTTTTTTNVNGQSSTQVTVNGQSVPVPKRGTVQRTIQNPDGSTTQLSVSSDSTGVTTNSFTSS